MPALKGAKRRVESARGRHCYSNGSKARRMHAVIAGVRRTRLSTEAIPKDDADVNDD